MVTVPTILGPVYVDDEGDAEEPVALLWPSLFTDHRIWRQQIATMRSAGWRTISIDPPGHGRSPGPGRTFTMDECAEAALTVLDARNVRTPVVIFGVSWGGFVAPRIALRTPQRVRGMVLFNTSAEPVTPLERLRATLLTKLLAVKALDKIVTRMIAGLMLAPQTLRRRPEIETELGEPLRAWNRSGVITTVRSVLVERDGVIDALPNVEAPVLIVSGKDDKLFPSVHSRRMAEKLPNARHVEIADAAHLVPLEAPQAANALIEDFVARLPRT